MTSLTTVGVAFMSRDQAATSSISVGSSSPLPVLLTRRDTGQNRTRSSVAGTGRVMARPAYGGLRSCESCRWIDVRRWHREGRLSPTLLVRTIAGGGKLRG